jgi:hypothetical protein
VRLGAGMREANGQHQQQQKKKPGIADKKSFS